MKVLVTGAGGFIGRAVCLELARRGVPVNPCFRSLPTGASGFAVGDVGPRTDWRAALEGCDTVLHLAGRAHQFDGAASQAEKFRQVNVLGSHTLFVQAAQRGVRRMVFVSSIGVNGNFSSRPFRETDVERPAEPYAVSKFEAERDLRLLAAGSGMELVIVRPPLVYGPGAPGNFGRLARLAAMPIPLPFAAIDNRRSLVGIGNLVDFLALCLRHPQAANHTFLVSDGEDVSTSALVRNLRRAMGSRERLFPVPVATLKFFGNLAGKRALVERLCADLQVDISKARDMLGWYPAIGVAEGLRMAVEEGRILETRI